MKQQGLTNLNSISGILFVASIIFFVVPVLVPCLSLNLAHLVLNKALWQGEQEALDRQQKVSLAARLLEIATGEQPKSRANAALEKQCAMIPALVLADYYRKQQDTKMTALWLRRAAVAEPSPTIQDAIILPGWADVTPQGDIVIDWIAADWNFRHDSQVADLEINDQNKQLTISYNNNLGQRDEVFYELRGPLALSYWHTLQLKARVHRGTYLTVAVHDSSGVKRHITYHEGTGQWEEFTIPLGVDSLRFIYISLSEPSSTSTVPDYAVDLEPLKLILDETAGACE